MRLVSVVLLATGMALGQGVAPLERSFAASKAEVEAALKVLDVVAGGRLPTLEGFVGEQSLPLERLQRARYAYAIEVTGKSGRALRGTRVRVRARITAWLAGANAEQSGYRELPSNGRLESDLLERLEDTLGAKAGLPVATAPANAASPPVLAASGPVLKAPSKDAGPKTAGPNVFATPRAGVAALPPRGVGDVPGAAGGRNSAGYEQSLRDEAKNLEEILRNQTRPSDLAAVRKAKTAVYSRPSEEGEVLFLADAEDEFQVLNTNSDWVHVQISGLSRGWIRGADLELPARGAGARSAAPAVPAPVPAATAVPAGEPAFRLAKQEVNSYPGDWAPLQGKRVRIYSLAPSGAGTTSAGQKWEVARAMFRRAAARLAVSAGEAVDGVVLIFDSADGGMASATVTSLKDWDEGRISEEVFRGECSLDPAEAFGK